MSDESKTKSSKTSALEVNEPGHLDAVLRWLTQKIAGRIIAMNKDSSACPAGTVVKAKLPHRRPSSTKQRSLRQVHLSSACRKARIFGKPLLKKHRSGLVADEQGRRVGRQSVQARERTGHDARDLRERIRYNLLHLTDRPAS